MIRSILALVCLCTSVQADPTLQANGAFRWTLAPEWFGGWSGIEITAQGTRMTVISDRGHIVQAALERSGGRLSGIAVTREKTLTRAGGEFLGSFSSDAEGLAIAEDGTAFISFEHHHRFMRADLETGRTFDRVALPFQNALEFNAGLEALAVGPDGALYAVAEKPQPDGAPFPLYAYKDHKWRISAHIPRRGPFLPVGADFDTKGRLWLLERAVTPLGFRSRIRLFVLDPAAPREHILLTTIPALYDNLEGISVWDDAAGQMHVTLISDDNFLPILRSQIVEYTVRE